MQRGIASSGYIHRITYLAVSLSSKTTLASATVILFFSDFLLPIVYALRSELLERQNATSSLRQKRQEEIQGEG